MNWSSGKDAALAFHLLSQQADYEVTHLLTTLSQDHDRVVMHGVRESLLDMQAQRMDLPLIKVKLPASPDDTVYKNAMLKALTDLKSHGVTMSSFGDIFLEDLKQYREQQLAQAGMSGLFPLWKGNTKEMVNLVEDSGIEAIVVCVNEKYLGKEYLGKKIGAEFLSSLPGNVDPCGENGEFHTFVHSAPFFRSAITIKTGEIVHKKYTSSDNQDWDTSFYFLDVSAD